VTVHLNDSDRQNERPSSYMSTCSADTGRFSVNIARWLADDELFSAVRIFEISNRIE